MDPLIWIIDEEWPDYDIEINAFNRAFTSYTVKYSGRHYEYDLNHFGQYADAIICQVGTNITGDFISKLKKCQVISVYGSGYDNVDVNKAQAKGIKVCSVPGYCAEDIADYVIAGIFYFNKKLNCYSDNIRRGWWGAQAAGDPARRIKGSSLLVVGSGRIGLATAVRAKALGLEVMIYDPFIDREIAAKYGMEKVEWEQGLQKADFISVHVKYDKSTEALFKYDDFKLMKKTACIINVSRGRVINQHDLIRAVKDGIIAGAALDVLDQEPPALDDKVLRCPGILVTPHISYFSAESQTELKYRAADNAIKVIKGEPGANLVTI